MLPSTPSSAPLGQPISRRHFLQGAGAALSLPLLEALLPGIARAAQPAPASGTPRSVTFEKRTLTTEYWCDGLTAADIDGDGQMDIVAGPFWYKGPDFKVRYPFFEPVPQALEANPTDSMFSFVYDFNGDGLPDILVLGRVLFHEAFWYENPGPGRVTDPSVRWKKHFVTHRVFGESPQFLDLNGDGKPELLSISGESAKDKIKQWGWYAPDWSNPTQPWHFVPITEKGEFNHYYHGTGAGDIDGDGRLDLVLNEGWWEQPPKSAPPGTLWTAHPFPRPLGTRGGAQIYVFDVDGDGLNDIVTSIDAHGWGLSWFQQKRAEGGAISFVEHRIMGDRSEEGKFGVAFSQPHALVVADLDGDGLPDIITGKRRWAHGPKGDIEPMATPVIYWFQLRRDGRGGATFIPHLIDDASGVGTQIQAIDVNGDGVPDVLSASKLGTFVFLTQRG